MLKGTRKMRRVKSPLIYGFCALIIFLLVFAVISTAWVGLIQGRWEELRPSR
jgi:hypothetical protein